MPQLLLAESDLSDKVGQIISCWLQSDLLGKQSRLFMAANIGATLLHLSRYPIPGTLKRDKYSLFMLKLHWMPNKRQLWHIIVVRGLLYTQNSPECSHTIIHLQLNGRRKQKFPRNPSKLCQLLFIGQLIWPKFPPLQRIL